MNKPTTLRTLSRATIRAALLVGGLVLAGAASAQTSATPDRASSEAVAKNATTSTAAVQHDPFSPFVYDALGATPSIRLPFQRSASPASKQAETKGRDAARQESSPSVSAAGQRTETVAR